MLQVFARRNFGWPEIPSGTKALWGYTSSIARFPVRGNVDRGEGMKISTLGSLGAMILLATAGRAQDGSETVTNRTPANAQKFLIATPPEAFFGVAGDSEVFVREGEVASPDACVTVISGSGARVLVSGDYAKYVKGRMRSLQQAGIWVRMDGRRVTEVFKGYEGYRAGLRIGDEIVSVNGEPITTPKDVAIALSKQFAAGGVAQITYLRNGATFGTSVTPHRAESMIEIPIAPNPAGSVVIDWSKVQQVTTSQSPGIFFVSLTTPGDAKSPVKWISFSVAATRDRVFAAAQYLQEACDKTKELGF
jgi:membrane-associated protease RseP (regulator of RpoE activity)